MSKQEGDIFSDQQHPLEIAPTHESIIKNMFLSSLQRLHSLPKNLRASRGNTALPLLAKEVEDHMLAPEIPGNESKRIQVIPIETNYQYLPSRMVIRGDSPDTLHLTLQLNEPILTTLDDVTIDSILVPYAAVSARFIRAMTATDIHQPDITFADRLHTIYREAYELQRLYMQHMNSKRAATFPESPAPEAVVKKVEEILFGNPARLPLDFGIQDVLIASEGPFDETIAAEPGVLRAFFNATQLAGNPQEQQKFLSAFSMYLVKILPPDTMQEAIMRKAIVKDLEAWTQADETRQALIDLHTRPHPLREFVFHRARLLRGILSDMYLAYKEQQREFHLEPIEPNPALFTIHDLAHMGALVYEVAIAQEQIGFDFGAQREGNDTA